MKWRPIQQCTCHSIIPFNKVLWHAEQKFSDLTNRVEMLETELIAMKLCKLKMEADKTEAELQVKEMEKTLHSLQNGHSSQVLGRHQIRAARQMLCLSVRDLCRVYMFAVIRCDMPGAPGAEMGIMACCLGLNAGGE